jgi:hypothetical protein
LTGDVVEVKDFNLLIFYKLLFPFLLDQKGEKKSSSLEALLFEDPFKKQANRPMLIASLFVRYAGKRTSINN